jgi:glycosyltransferase involved in cell wall biosynthesis
LDRLAGLTAAGAGTIRVGLVATYARWKGQDLFLEAVKRLMALGQAKPVRFYVIGGPVYRTPSQFSEEELRALAKCLGVANHVGFIPFQEDPAGIYRALDVVVHASTRPEPFGRTIVEAMSCGRAVVASPEGGAREVFRDGHDALGFLPRDPESLAAAIHRLVESDALRSELGVRGRETAVARFARNLMGPRILRVYQDLIARRSTTMPPDSPDYS